MEEFYQIPKEQILYIHNNAKAYDELIFGHGQTSDHADVPTYDENGEPTRTPYTDTDNASRSPFYDFYKDTKAVLKQHRLWFSSLASVEEVIILGHSIGKVDWLYFRKIAKQATGARWMVSYYGENELLELNKRVKSVNREANIQIITFADLQ